MNNVDKAMELSNRHAENNTWETWIALRTHLEAMEADRVRLLEALKSIVAMETRFANATVQRMANAAKADINQSKEQS